jgi:nucleotide-binding universal stress UspA family protein
MLRTMLVPLDGSEPGSAAVALAMRWARRHGALAVGCAVVDEPGIRVSEGTLFAEGFYAPGDQTLAQQARVEAEGHLSRFEAEARAAGVRSRTVLLVGTPHVQVVAEAHRYDVVVLGRTTHLEFGHRGAGDVTLERVVQESPRPVVLAPEGPEAGDDGTVLVAFDGSTRSSRALMTYRGSGLAEGRVHHVISVDRDAGLAAGMAERAAEYLRHHDLEVHAHPFDGTYPPIDAILGAVERLGVGLLVIGAYGHGALRELVLGSTTRRLFAECPAPVFCTH